MALSAGYTADRSKNMWSPSASSWPMKKPPSMPEMASMGHEEPEKRGIKGSTSFETFRSASTRCPSGPRGAPSVPSARRRAVPPHQAMLLLKAGNERFVRGRPMAAPIDHQARQHLDLSQGPHTAVVGCADCPVPLETIFDSMPGDIFALRNAGNACTHAEGSIMGSVEFCCTQLGSRLILVLGHSHCKAIEEATRTYLESSGRRAQGLLLELSRSVELAASELGPRAARAAELVAAAVKVNVFRTVNYLLQSSKTIQEKVKKGHVEVLGAVFDNKTGRVEFLGKSPNEALLLSEPSQHLSVPATNQAEPGSPAPRSNSDSGRNPALAMKLLTEGNARFALGTERDALSCTPKATFAAILSCSDLHLSPEKIFGAASGELFVLSNTGNSFSGDGGSLIGSLEFCAGKLNVSVILVLGHRGCDAWGACARSARVAAGCACSCGEDRSAGHLLNGVMHDMSAVIDRAQRELQSNREGQGIVSVEAVAEHAIRANVFHTMEHLLRHSERLTELLRQGELEVQGGIFDKESGCVEFLGHLPRLNQLLVSLDTSKRKNQRERSKQTASSCVSAQDALKLLREGNNRWVSSTAVASRIPKTLASDDGRAPFCAIIGCADLRTPVEQLFDTLPGEIFVLRNAGNTITHAKGSVMTSLEFCTCKLMTKLVLVLGHTDCMALSSAMCGESSEGKASEALLKGIRSCGCSRTEELTMEEAVEANVRHTIDCLLKYSSGIQEKVENGQLEIHGAIYDGASGHVRFLCENTLMGA